MKGVDDIYPLTPSQLGILYDSLRDRDPELYFEQVRCDLVGDVDVDALRTAWNATIDANAALRTIWLWKGLDDPVQVVRERVELPWEVLDWSERPLHEHIDALDELARIDRSRGFDLTKPPVMRITVVRLDDRRVHLMWSFHHIMLDGWSAAIVLDHVLDRYAGREVPTPRPFRDHVAWIGAQNTSDADAHWQSLFAGFDHPTRLAVDRGPSDDPFRLERTVTALDAPTTARLVNVARQHRVTVNTLVQAAWATVLSCNSGDDDVVFGVTGSGRPAEIDGVEDMVGMFLATLPMRVRFEPERPVIDWWADIQRQQLDQTSYQYSSLAEIARWSDVPHGVPLFDTALIFENFPGRDAGGDVTVERRSVFEQTRFPLTLMIGPGERLEVLALFDASRFDAQVVDDLLGQFVHVLARMTEQPELALRSLTVVSDDEQRRMLLEWNQTDRPVPDTTVHGEIARHAAANPEAVALIDGDRRWSFGELVAAADRLSARIQATGATPGRAIGVTLPRSAELVVALLAVIRTGAAYVPLEPGGPAERLAAIAEDAELAMALTTPDHAAFYVERNVPVIDIDAMGDEAAVVDEPPEVAAAVAPDDPMFVIFTSGSTGRPKGVPGSHRAVLNRCTWQHDAYPFEHDETACQKTTLSFVDHVAELWAPLIAGRPVLIVGDDIVHDPRAFVAVLAQHHIHRIVIVPSLLSVLLDTIDDLGARLPKLRLWTLSGERLPRELADRFHAAVPHATLLNVYGMSEAMADATCYDDRWASTAETLPIGRPIHNLRVYVLDRVGRVAPIGVPGQIWISGVGLAMGYWQRDDLTAERFVANPFGDGDHDRLYATGDVGRWTDDGLLEYLGRIDRQVKVRGARVELGEVEAAVLQLDGIHDSVVVDASSESESARLVAHVVCSDDVDLTAARRRLLDRVPDYLVPAELHRIDAIPLLPSGKPDRRALAEVETSKPVVDAGPIDDGLRSMIEMWQEVIGTTGIGPDDDFFDVGGHSIAAMRLMSRIKREHDVDLELSVLHDESTPRSLWARVDAGGVDEKPSRHLVPITRASDSRHVLYCIHGAGGNVLNFRELARHLMPDWSVIGVQASGVDGVTPPHTTMDEMCEAYIADILDDRSEGPLFLAGFSSGGIIAYEMAVRLAERGEDVGALILFDTFHPAVKGRRRTLAEHIGALRRQRRDYLFERLEVRRQRRLYERAPEIVDAERRDGGAVPHELRDAHLVSNIRSILADYEAPHYGGRIWMFAANDVLDVYRHAGPDRGWSRSAEHIEIDPVPGDHDTLVLEPHAEHLAARLLERLNGAIRDESSERAGR